MKLLLCLLICGALACVTTPTPPEPSPRPQPPPPSGTPTPPPAPVPPPAPAAQPIPPRPLTSPPPMDVVIVRSEKPIVSIKLVFKTGSIDDPKGKEGITTLTGDLMAEGGTRKLSSSQLLEALFPMAARLASRTDKELTVFEGRVHKDHLDRFLDIFTDVLLEPRMDPREFERLKLDALNSIRNTLRGENDEALGKVALDALLYPGHPYAHFVNGTVQGLSSITLDDVKAHMARVFTQDRLVVGLAGPVDEALERKVRERLSALPKTGAPAVQLPPAPGVRQRALVLQKPALSTAISMGYAYPLRRGDPDFFPVAFAMSYLGEHRQFNGVLFNELRERRGMNYGDYAYAEHFIQEGYGTFARTNIARGQQDFSIWIRPVEPANGIFATRGALYFLRRLIDEGIPKEHFELTRGFLLGYTRLWEQTDDRRLGYAIDDRLYGTQGFLESYRKALATLTPEAVHEAVKRNLRLDNLNFVFVAQDAKGLAELLVRQPPTPITYPTPKAAEVLEVDKAIIGLPLPISPASVEIQSAQDFMER